MGIVKLIFNDEDTAKKAEKIVNHKKLNVYDKYFLIKKIYVGFFNYGLKKDAILSLYELHYEDIMDAGKVKKDSHYNKLLNEEIKNHTFYNVFVLCKQFDNLINQGLDVNLLPKDDQFANDLIKLKSECGFNENFDGTKFYNDAKTRSYISGKINAFLEKYKAEQKNEIECEM
ncbi:MAG: hypothetical protein ACI4TZ_01060 [Christensenellales bacterium]